MQHSRDIEMLVRGADATPFSKLAYHLMKAEDEAIKEALADDIVWTMMPNGAVLDGKEQVFEFLKPAFASVEIRMPELIGNVALKDWGVLEYWNKGIIDDKAIAFAQSFWGQNRLPIDRDSIIGKEHKMAVCFVYHINTQGKIDLVREYLDIGSYITQAHPRPAQYTEAEIRPQLPLESEWTGLQRQRCNPVHSDSRGKIIVPRGPSKRRSR